MKSRVEAKARAILRDGITLTKYDLAEVAPCHPKVAQRVLSRLHAELRSELPGMRVVGWTHFGRAPIPIYGISGKNDVPRPVRPGMAEYMREYRRNNPEAVDRANAARRSRRSKPSIDPLTAALLGLVG